VRLFADTWFYLALINARDENHAVALEWAVASNATVVTTQWILIEVANALSGSQIRGQLKARFDDLSLDPHTLILEVSPLDFTRGMQLYGKRSDKAWSLTDCISFILMADEGPEEALTGDHHFEQAGFTAVLAVR
jgi:uncharacterized protein